MQKHKFELEEDLAEDNRPELVADTEKLYFLLSHNLTKEAKNIVWDFLSLAKAHYPQSSRKKYWNNLLINLQAVIDDFENEISDKSLLKLYGIQRTATELHGQEFDNNSTKE